MQHILITGSNDIDLARPLQITCDARTGRISEIDLAVTENLAALYPELRAVIAAFEQNPIAQSIATNKRTVQAAEMQLTTQKAPWEDPTIPHSLTAWPAGMYPYSAITMEALPSGPAFLKLNQTLRALHISNAVLLKQTLPAEWGSFVSLRELTLTGLDLRGTLPGEWAGMINMTQLILADNPNLHGSLPAAWSTMKQMKLLDVSLNYASGLRSGISGTLPQSWSSMAKLETLNLWRTSVVGHLPPSWADMKRLQVLALSDTGISGSLPSAWSRMPKLATVHVANTLIGGSLPSSWAKLPNLALLDLRGTAVMEPVPSSWKALCKRNGTKVWDSVAAAYSWPPSLQYGQVAHVYLPWVGPDGNLWEINHDDFSLCNACRHLMSERSMQGPLVIVVCCVLFGLVGFMFRAGVSPMYQHLKSRQV